VVVFELCRDNDCVPDPVVVLDFAGVTESLGDPELVLDCVPDPVVVLDEVPVLVCVPEPVDVRVPKELCVPGELEDVFEIREVRVGIEVYFSVRLPNTVSVYSKDWRELFVDVTDLVDVFDCVDVDVGIMVPPANANNKNNSFICCIYVFYV